MMMPSSSCNEPVSELSEAWNGRNAETRELAAKPPNCVTVIRSPEAERKRVEKGGFLEERGGATAMHRAATPYVVQLQCNYNVAG